jgi:hypothetical protein
MKLPKITKKQQEILTLLYRYRFLNRLQIQTFMGHTDKRRISAWLKDLREDHFVEWIYDPFDFAKKTEPAIYYLGINGVRYLRQRTYSDDDGEYFRYLPSDVRKRYREATRSRSYVDRCLLLADFCIAMEQVNDGPDAIRYSYQTEADYLDPGSKYFFISESELIHPHVCYSQKEDTGRRTITRHYLLEVFDQNLPRYRMGKRLKDYVKYLEEEDYEWQEHLKTKRLPNILIICPRTTDLIYAKRKLRGLLAQIWDEEKRVAISFALTTAEKLKAQGIRAVAWEQA